MGTRAAGQVHRDGDSSGRYASELTRVRNGKGPVEPWRLLLGATVGLAVGVAFLPNHLARWVTAAGGLLALAAIAAAVVRDGWHWGRNNVVHRPLTLIGVALAFVVAGESWHAVGAAFPSRGDVVSMAAYPLVLVGLLQLTRARLGERSVDTLLVAAIAAVSLLAFGWIPLTSALPHWVEVTHRGSWLPAAFLAVDALAIAITARLAVVFRTKPTGYQFLLGAFVAMLGAHTARAAAAMTGAVPAPVGTQALLLVGVGLVGTAALHPSLSLATTGSPRPASLGKGHLLLLGGAVAVGPVIVMVQYAHKGGWVFLAAGGPAAISFLVMAHLWRIALERGRLEHLTLHDPLTGLPNRVLFHERLEQAVAGADEGVTFAVGLLDLDRFKKVNDSMGHAAGDELLRQVAGRLEGAARQDDCIARLAGDEFAFLLAQADEAGARLMSARLHEVFRDRFHISGRDVFMSPSVGVAVFPAHGYDADTLLAHADIAMYKAKSAGRDAVEVYTGCLSTHAHQDLALETALHRALECEELVLHYQPQVRLDTGALVGVEALVRWDHPDFGLIPPGAFVHFAEESGLIVPLGQWVLQEACRQGAAWLAGGNRIPVSVNLSARQFQLQDLAMLVAEVLAETGLPSELLELELTESLSFDEQDSVLSTLADLRALGVRCSIDDFGTGYSGLGYLSRYPIDSLKLDRSFVADISAGDAPIVRAIIAMAHSLNLEVIAEGVETPDQAAFLRGQRCDVLQGFLASRPLPPQEVIAGVAEWVALARRSWHHDGVRAQPGEVAGVTDPVEWSEQLLGELLTSVEPEVVPSVPGPRQVEEAQTEPSGTNHVHRTLVLTSAAGVLTLPVFLGLGAANALPPAVQAMVTASLSGINATTPQVDAPPAGRPRGRGTSPSPSLSTSSGLGPGAVPAQRPAASARPQPARTAGRTPTSAGGGTTVAAGVPSTGSGPAPSPPAQTGQRKAPGKPSGTGSAKGRQANIGAGTGLAANQVPQAGNGAGGSTGNGSNAGSSPTTHRAAGNGKGAGSGPLNPTGP